MAPKDKPVLTVYINHYSDGDLTHRPVNAGYFEDDEAINHREKLAVLWMKDRGEYNPAFKYVLDRLPNGYAVLAKPRIKDNTHIDKWVYGHPSKKTFDSANRFYPHFLALMNGSTANCACDVCTKGSSRGPPGLPLSSMATMTASGPQFQPINKPAEGDHHMTDDEGTPNETSRLIARLKKHGKLDEPFREAMSFDWRSEKKVIGKWLDKLAKQPRWLPRVGEIVLYARNLEGTNELRYDAEDAHRYRIWSNTENDFIGDPKWEAGVVGQASTSKLRVDDLIRQRNTMLGVNVSGFRIESYPDPNNDEKAETSHVGYFPLASIRPFAYHERFLEGMDVADWHPTVQNAVTASSVVSLVAKFRFAGEWPWCTILCRGAYIGHELITINDLVWLLPEGDDTNGQAKVQQEDTTGQTKAQQGDTTVIEVLQVAAIKLKMWNLDKVSASGKRRPYNSTVYLDGRVFTLTPRESGSFSPDDLPSPLSRFTAHGQWREKYGPDVRIRVPFNRVLCRCLEDQAMYTIFAEDIDLLDPPPLIPPHIVTLPLTAVPAARQYSAAHLRTIDRATGKAWYLAECRAEAVDIHSLNGGDVAMRDEARDPLAWRRELHILDGTATAAERKAEEMRGEEYIPLSLRRATEDGLPPVRNSMVTNALVHIDEDDEDALDGVYMDTSVKGEVFGPVYTDDELSQDPMLVEATREKRARKRSRTSIENSNSSGDGSIADNDNDDY